MEAMIFKFQSDSINTVSRFQAACAGPPLNSNMILLIQLRIRML